MFDNYRGNVTSEGYLREAKDVADWFRREDVRYKEMTLDEFKSSAYYNQTGIIYQVAQSDSIAHIDIYSEEEERRGMGFMVTRKLCFFR